MVEQSLYRVSQKKCPTLTKCRLHLLANTTTHCQSGKLFQEHPVVASQQNKASRDCLSSKASYYKDWPATETGPDPPPSPRQSSWSPP